MYTQIFDHCIICYNTNTLLTKPSSGLIEFSSARKTHTTLFLTRTKYYTFLMTFRRSTKCEQKIFRIFFLHRRISKKYSLEHKKGSTRELKTTFYFKFGARVAHTVRPSIEPAKNPHPTRTQPRREPIDENPHRISGLRNLLEETIYLHWFRRDERHASLFATIRQYHIGSGGTHGTFERYPYIFYPHNGY